MTLDYLTEDLSCVDAFLVKYETMIPSTKPSFLSPDCLELRGACNPSAYSVSVLGNELWGFQARLETCSVRTQCVGMRSPEVSYQLHLLDTNKRPCSEPWLTAPHNSERREQMLTCNKAHSACYRQGGSPPNSFTSSSPQRVLLGEEGCVCEHLQGVLEGRWNVQVRFCSRSSFGVHE